MQVTDFLALVKLPQEYRPSMPPEKLRKKLLENFFDKVTFSVDKLSLVGTIDYCDYSYRYNNIETCYVLDRMIHY